MKKVSLVKVLGLALGCAALALGGTSANAREFLANGGTTFGMTPIVCATPPTAQPAPPPAPQPPGWPTPSIPCGSGYYWHLVDGVVWVSILGDCTFHGAVVAVAPASPSSPWTGWGTFTITTADGDQLFATAVGYFPPDPAWGAAGYGVLDIHYKITFAGGTGKFTHAHGSGEIFQGFASLAQQPGYANFFGSPNEIMVPALAACAGPVAVNPYTGPIYPPDADLIDPNSLPNQSGDLTGKACWLMRGNLLGVSFGDDQNGGRGH